MYIARLLFVLRLFVLRMRFPAHPLRYLSIPLLLLFFLSHSASANLPGASPSGFGVSDGGAATFSLQISAPPGTGGVAPKISMSYNHQGGNGVLGVGGSISGFSAVHRCVHEVTGTIEHDDTDEFCLDGQKLILTSGTHGVAGAMYRTELDSFSEITAYGSSINRNGGSAPLNFRVRGKDGTILWFGGNEGSRIKLPGTTSIHKWMLSKTEDRNGNYAETTFDMVRPEQCLPVEINYTANDTMGLAFSKKIVFEYEDRPDKTTTWIAGGEFKNDVRINSVKTYNNNLLDREYNVSYDSGDITDLSRMTEVQECAYDENGVSHCLPATEFYRAPQTVSSTQNTAYELPNGGALTEIYQTQQDGKRLTLSQGELVDVNADGLVDWVKAYTPPLGSPQKETWLNTPTGWVQDSNWTLPDVIVDYSDAVESHNRIDEEHSAITHGQFSDINGDGLIDWVQAYDERIGNTYHQEINTWLNTGSGWSQSSNYILPGVLSSADYKWQGHEFQEGVLVDIDGDGLPDYLTSYKDPCGATHESAMINDGAGGWTSNSNYELPELMVDYSKYSCSNGNDSSRAIRRGELIDLNADGLVDWVTSYQRNSTYKSTYLNTGSGWALASNYATPEVLADYDFNGKLLTHQSRFVDVNSDGLSDFVHAIRKNSGHSNISKDTWLNTGDGWTLSTAYELPSVMMDYRHDFSETGGISMGLFTDINADGRVDWLVSATVDSDTSWSNNPSSNTAWLNTGAGWVESSDYSIPNTYRRYRDRYKHPTKNSRQRIEEGYTTGTFVDINGDGAADWLRSHELPDYPGYTTVNQAYINDVVNPDLITQFTNTAGSATQVVYSPMNNPAIYDKGGLGDYSYFDLTSPSHHHLGLINSQPLVQQTQRDNGLNDGSSRDFSYYYVGMRYNTQGEGSLGFRRTAVIDHEANKLNLKSFYQHFPYVGMMEAQSKHTIDLSKKYSESHNAVNYHRILHGNGAYTYFPYTESATSSSYEIDGSLVSSSSGTVQFDGTNVVDISASNAFGNQTWANSSISDGTNPAYSSEVTTQYQNNVTDWLVGLRTQMVSTVHHPSKPSESSTEQYTYTSLGEVDTSIVQVGTPYELTTAVVYDGFGNTVQSTLSGTGVTSRTSSTTYDSTGSFVLSSSNALGHTQSMTYDARCSMPNSTTDINGNTSYQAYDAYCRPTVSTTSIGTQSTVSFHNESIPGSFYVETQATDSPTSREYKNTLMQTFHTRGEDFNGDWVGSDVQFDARGRTLQSSHPYFVNEAVLPIINGANGATLWTVPTYDEVSRVTQTTAADGSISTVVYNGLVTETTNDLLQTKTVVTNARGETVSITDNAGTQIQFEYDARGNLVETTDANGENIVLTYDVGGQKIGMDDPDMGLWTYQYNRLGQMVSQTDAKGNTITMTYDILGRMDSRTTAEGTSTWTFDTASNGLGALAGASGPNYSRTHSYDSNSRPQSVTSTVFGQSETIKTHYNINGKVGITQYITEYPNDLAITYSYNALGYHTQTRRKLPESAYDLLWKVDDVDVYGRVTEEHIARDIIGGGGVVTSYAFDPLNGRLDGITSNLGSAGNGLQDLAYTYDSIGNMLSRSDDIYSRSDDFTYDSLNRLTSVDTTNTLDTKTVNVVYDEMGNITSKTDVGEYNYDQTGNAGPNAVTSVTSNTFNPTFPSPVINVYDEYFYDANGNLTAAGALKDTQGNFISWGKQIAWTSFNKPSSISTVTDNTTYDYGPEHQRIRKINSSENTEILYYGKSLERHEDNGTVDYKYYIPAGSATLQLTLNQQGASDVWTHELLLKDHLGSTDVILDEAGVVTERLSFDPWGLRREEDWGHSATLVTSSSNRGFTGHEMDDDIGLINMNARIYDPVLGRFLSPDSVLPDPSNMQTYNRYSYVMNSPMGYTDPSGHEPLDTPYYNADGRRVFGDGSVESEDAYIGRMRLTYLASFRSGVSNDLGGKITAGNLKEISGNYLRRARNILGCDSSQCSAGYLLTFTDSRSGRNLADFGLGADDHAAVMTFLFKSASANQWAKKLKKKKRMGTIMTVTKLAMNFIPGGAIMAAAMTFGQSGFELSSLAGAVVGAMVGGAIGAVGIEPGLFSSTLGGGITSKLLGGSFTDGAIGGAIGYGISQGVKNFGEGGTPASKATSGSQQADSNRIWKNPTGGQVRGCDAQGCGGYGARRSYGSHQGTDYIATPSQSVVAVTSGTITKIGYPYGDDLSYRYTSITTSDGYVVRQLYVSPASDISVGSSVSAGQNIGTAQSLGARYPGITDHIHVDIQHNGVPIDPTTLIPEK